MKMSLDTGAARFRGSRRWKILSDCNFFTKCVFFFGASVRKTLAFAMSNGERDFVVVGSARRRRERRLRCFLRHEEMAVRMALARATHHAVQRHQCTQTVSPPLAATYAATPAPSLVIEYVVPALDVTHAAPAPVFKYMTPAHVIEYIAPTPAVTYVVPSQQLLLSTPRQPSLLTSTSTLSVWFTRKRLLRHKSLVLFLPVRSLLRPCATKSIRNRSLQERQLKTHLCKNR